MTLPSLAMKWCMSRRGCLGTRDTQFAMVSSSLPMVNASRGGTWGSARDAFAVGTGSAAKSATERPRMLLRYQFCVNSSQS